MFLDGGFQLGALLWLLLFSHDTTRNFGLLYDFGLLIDQFFKRFFKLLIVNIIFTLTNFFGVFVIFDEEP